MTTEKKVAKGTKSSTFQTMASIVVVVFITEAVVMGLFGLFGRTPLDVPLMLLDAIVLSLLVAPPIYGLILLPIRREHEQLMRTEEKVEDLTHLAITDALTHIMNRRGVTMALLDAMAQSERYNTPLIIGMADIDHFKRINDNHGHEAGDKALVEIASVFSEELRMPDKVGRYGGEEFLLILPHTTLVQGSKIADRIRAAVAKRKISLDGEKISLTLSLGVVQFKAGEDLEQFLSRADRALYEAKEGGRNRVVVQKKEKPASKKSAARPN